MVLKSASRDLASLAEEVAVEVEKGADAASLTSVLDHIRQAHDALVTAIASSAEHDAPKMSNPYKSDNESEEYGDKEKTMQKSFDNLPDEVVDYIEELEAGLDILADDLVAAQKALAEVEEISGHDGDDEDLFKSVSDPVRKAVEVMRQENEELRKAVEIERTNRLDKDATLKAARWETLTLKADEFGPALRRVEDLDPELAVQIERALDAANTAVSTSKAFEEIGTVSKGSTDAWGEIESLAKAKSAEHGITFSEAVTVVANERPDLYRRHQQEV